MDLGRNIHQLLKHKKEVYVKGLGTFKRIRTSSVFDDKKGVFLPPVNYLEFDNKSDDGADFIDYIQQSNYLSRSEAESVVEEEVKELLSNLSDNGTAGLNYLGQLIKHGSSLVFKPEDISSFRMVPIPGQNENVDHTSENSSFENTDSTDLSEASESEVIQEKIIDDSMAIDDQDELTEEEALENYNKGKSSRYIWVAIISVLVIAGLFYFNYSYNANNLEEDSQVTQPISEKLTDSVVLDSLAVAEIPAKDTTVVKVYNPLIPENHTYQIVIGTHNTLALAYEQAESFNKAGIQSVRVIPSNLAHNKKKVIWDSYLTKQEADSALRYVRKHYVSDAWHQKVNK